MSASYKHRKKKIRALRKVIEDKPFKDKSNLDNRFLDRKLPTDELNLYLAGKL